MNKVYPASLLGLCLATTICAEESENLIQKDNWVLDGDVWMQESSGGKDYQSDFNIRFGAEGGTATQDLDFSAYEQVDAFNYSMMAIGCNNSGNSWCDTGTGYDELIVTLNYGDEQWVHNITLDYADGFTLHEATSIPTGYSTTGSVSIWGKDVGVWPGWYGPVTADHTFTVTYSVPQYDVVLDTPGFLDNVTGTQDNIMDIAVSHDDTMLQQQDLSVPDVADAVEMDMQMDMQMDMDMAMDTQEIQVELEIQEPEAEIQVEAEAEVEIEIEIEQPQEAEAQQELEAEPEQTQEQEPEPEQEQAQEQRSIRLDTIMDNVTIGGVSATDLGQTDAYNQVAQAVAISLLTAPRIKDTYIEDAPFYKQAQLKDGSLNKSYTGYAARSNSVINRMVDMQWQRLR